MNGNKDHYSYRIYADPKVAAGFDADRFGGSIGEFIKHSQESVVFDMLGNTGGWRVLDVGAGTGRFTIPFVQNGARVTATDASSQMLEVLRAKVNDPALEIKVADAHELPFPDRQFECTVCFRLLLHVIDWKKALAELCRTSSDWLVFDIPPRRGFLLFVPLVHAGKKIFSGDVQTYRTFPTSEITAELQRNGFEIVAVDPGYFLPIGLHRLFRSVRFSRSSEAFFRKLRLTKIAGSPLTIFARRRK